MDVDFASLTAGLEEARRGLIHYTLPAGVASELEDVWDPRPMVREKEPYSIEAVPKHEDHARGAQPKRAGSPPKRPPPWFVGMSSDFSKGVAKIDRKLQGRILEALVQIAEHPMEVRGDTVKPLVGELKGCWRYRVGDFRIIYSPDKSTGDITLLAFDARGSAYAL